MNRRKALQSVAVLMGGTVIGGSMLLQHGCKPAAKKVNSLFDENQVKLMDEIADTIIPDTSTPGAKAAQVGAFMALMVQDCYTPADQKVFTEGLIKIEEASKAKYGKSFMDITPAQRTEMLTALDAEQKEYQSKKQKDDPAHYFRMMKELTLFGYFTSEIGATKALRYVQVPGKYDPCLPYKKGDKAWAT
ncbi:MAG TPA: gluconate 2-dehydrogenase subunit 3 family protein [Phnomibacter sp.]|nr:gluconate 2-dehydrogenase subunit 3 family protein [Phnomibacter sp.]